MPVSQVLAVSTPHDPRCEVFLQDARALGFLTVQGVQLWDLYRFDSALNDEDKRKIEGLAVDPIAQHAHWDQPAAPDDLDVSYRPGVTDTVAEQLQAALARLGLGALMVATGTRFSLIGPITPQERQRLGRLLFYNETVQTLQQVTQAPGRAPHVQVLELLESSPTQLKQLAGERRSALDEAEMLSLQSYFRGLGRDPSDAEFEMIAQTWSEHCCHKTFRALIEVENGPTVDGLLKQYLRAATEAIAAPWVVSAFEDNAGIIEFDEDLWLAIKVETHNHPSAIEPFGGANTGVGGVVRDVLGVSARPIAATDVLCFAPLDMVAPEGVLPPRRLQSGVVAGIQDYGNKLGVPIVNGAVRYHPGYLANPLVYCGCLGLLRRGQHPRNPLPGDRLVVLGGRVGRDGIRGATFSSMTMEADSGVVAGASVQIGNPFLEKGLIEVVCAARDGGLYHAITDCGAGGLSSAVGEMAAELGVQLELAQVPLKYAGLDPWEIWLSEAQERMVMAAAPDHIDALRAVCQRYGIEATDLGHFEASGKIRVTYEGQSLIDLDCQFLHQGLPRQHLTARIPAAVSKCVPERTLEEWLADPDIASKESIIRRFDHEVQGGSLVRPLVGVHQDAPSDGAVLRPQGYRGRKAVVLSLGLALCEHDAYREAWEAVDEAIRNAVCLGANPDRLAILDNFCWGDPRRPETLGSLVEACRACHDAALAYGTPFVSGKDSLNNEYAGEDGRRQSIPGTLLISCLGRLEDRDQALTSDLKEAGNTIYLLESPLPARELYRAFHRAVVAGLVRSAHDASEGGLAVAVAEMCIGGRLGATLSFPGDPFRESPGRLLVEVTPDDETGFQDLLPTAVVLGRVEAAPLLSFGDASYALEDLIRAFRGER